MKWNVNYNDFVEIFLEKVKNTFEMACDDDGSQSI